MAEAGFHIGQPARRHHKVIVIIGHFLTRTYRKGILEAEGFPIAEVSEYLEQSDTVVWVDVCTPNKGELHDLAGELGLHELAVEDALAPTSVPSWTITPPTSS
ncbi:MAG: hypothetical protein ACRD1T_16695, partial [Acidimicrobiia bacterium]